MGQVCKLSESGFFGQQIEVSAGGHCRGLNGKKMQELAVRGETRMEGGCRTEQADDVLGGQLGIGGGADGCEVVGRRANTD